MIKATRKLSEFNFDEQGAAVALVGPLVGGAANGRTTLLTKSLKEITDVEVQKASEVTVTMSIVDFLCKFFSLWYDDALVLALAMGYDVGDDGYSFVEASESYEDYLQERVDAIHIMKSLVLDNELDGIKKAVGELPSKDYLSILKAQEQFEKNFDAAVEKCAVIKKSSSIAAEGVTAEKSVNTPSVEIKEEDSMSEFITKAVHEAAIAVEVQKAKDAFGVELQKALDEVAVFKAEKEEAIVKSRKAALSSVEADEAKVEELLKSLSPLSQEAFDVVVKSLKAKEEKLEDSDLFVQKSKNVEVEDENGKDLGLKLVGDLINKSKNK